MKFFNLILLVASISAWGDATYKPGTFQIDPAHSKVGFEIPHLVISTVEGRFTAFEGNVILDPKFEKSSVKATVEISSIDTGDPKRDEHLKSPDFFDVGKFKTMAFVSKSITGTPESFKLNGSLTIKGKTNAVTFDGKYLGIVNDGNGKEKAVFTATAKIKRAEYGLTWNKLVEAGPAVGDELTIQLKIQAGRPAAAKAPAKK